MCQVKSKNATSSSNSKRSFARLVLMLLICFVSIITFSACSWTNSPDTSESNFDKDGNLRIQSPYVYFNPDSNLIIDDISGSFTWELAYFINDGTKNVDYDQSYYLSNFYYDSKYESIYNYYDHGNNIKPKYFASASDAVAEFGISTVEGSGAGFYGIDQSDPIGTKVIRVYTPAEKVINRKGSISFPNYEVVVDGKYYTFKVTLNTSYLKTDVGEDNPFKDLSYDYDEREFKEEDADGNDVKSLFSFSYRVGKASTNSNDFLPCPEGFMTYYIDDDDRFMIRFNPRLEEGSTSRYIKVRALTSTENGRTNSLYSNTVAYEAYTMTFATYSPNSTSLDYGSLIYDEGKFYFHTVKEVYNNSTGQNDISSIVGVFPEGRRVEVSRQSEFNDNYDYALQSWTMNAKAENSISLSETFPSITIESVKYSMIDYANTGTTDDYYKDLLRLSNKDTCIPTASITGSEAFAEIQTSFVSTDCTTCAKTGIVGGATCEDCKGRTYVYPTAPTYNYYTKGEVDNLANPNKYAIDTIYDMYDATGKKVATRSLLSVVSHYKVNGFKFYANFAKVRDFTLSGTFFAGDNFFTGGNQYLTNVTVSVFDKNGNRLCISDINRTYAANQLNGNEDKNGDGTPDADGEKASSVVRINDISFEFDGAHFEISGLEIGDYLMFEKIGAPLLEDEVFENASNLPFGFHSTQMIRLDIESIGINTKVLCVKETDDLYTDRQDIGVIGTQYAEESNLTVNLYQVDPMTGESTTVDGGLRLLNDGNVSYEVIKSVSSYEDKYGYITTNVIISILLPSNATLVGYNAETINESQVVYYSTGSATATPKYILKRTYDKESLEYSMDFENDLYSFSTSAVNSGDIAIVTSGNFITYLDDTYTYSHNSTSEIGGVLTTTSFYNRLNEPSATSYQVLAKVVTPYSTTWQLIVYDKVDGSRISGTIQEGGEGAEQIRIPVFTIDGNTLYQYTGTNSIATGEANEVSTIVSVYKTEMTQTVNGTTNNIYAYYDVKVAHEKAYYTSPIAKEHYVESDKAGEEGSITIDIAYYFAEITNFDALKSAGKIMLGTQILAGTSSLAREFRDVLGAKIVSTCYYYIAPIGETVDGKNYQPITVLAKQYLQTVQSQGQQQVNTTYYYKEGSTFKVFAGQADTATVIAYQSSLTALNMSGIIIDLEKLKSIETGIMYDASGILSYDIGYNKILGAHDYKSSHIVVETDTLGEENQKVGYTFVETTDQTVNGLKIRYAYTLYEIDKISGGLTTTQLYYNKDTNLFYRIEDTYPISYPITVDGEEIIETKTVSEVKTGTGFTIKVKNSSGSLLDRIRVEQINGVSKVQTYTQQEKSGNSVVSKSYTSYLAYLVPSYYVKNIDGKTETQIYNMIYQGSDQAIPSSFSVSSTPVYKITGKVNGVSVQLYPEITTSSVVSNNTALVRTAQIANTNTQVTLLGKYIQTGDSNEPIVYPSFSNLNEWALDEAFILKGNGTSEADMFDHYYALDYTSKKLVIEGFPGVSLLAGSPYPNPVLYLSVRHKKTEEAIVNISFDIKNAYYVEIMGTQIKTEDSNLIRDFTTYAFKDTVTNLTLNDYIDKSYWILDSVTLKPIIPYVKNGSNYVPKLLDEDDNPVELSIQDVGINEDSLELYFADTISATGKYKEKIYMQYVDNTGKIAYKTINYEQDVILWRTDATKVEKVPMYDIHSYTQGKDGIIYFDSGTDTDDNVLCIGLEGISSGATQTEDAMFNYDEVLVSGVTSAYRTKASELNISSEMYYGYWLDKGLNVMNAYDSNDAYFLSGKESVVIVASPTVQVNDENGNNYIYRFKEWQIYSRYNSEVMYYNRGLTENLIDRENAILRFSSNEAGYFVILPVYQRVYKIDLGTAVIDGAINQGGEINVLYSGGADVDVEGATKEELYLIEYFKTEFNNVEGYYYSNIIGAPYLWFTGELDKETSMPIFEHKDNIYAIRFNQTYKRFYTNYSTGDIILYFELIMSGDNISGVKPVRVLSDISVGYPGLVPVTNENGQYFICGTTYLETYDLFRLKTGTAVDDYGHTYSTSEPMRLKELISHTFTGEFFFDSILSETSGNKVSIVVHYDEESKRFFGFDLTTLNNRVSSKIPEVDSLLEYLAYWNMIYNSHIFSDAQVFEKIGKKFKDYYNDNPDDEKLTFTSFNINSSITDPIARCITNYHTVMYKNNADTMVGDNFYRSTESSLDAGELAYDEEGNLYSTIQFKTAYIDRDTTVKLVASPDHGYRVEGWYMCVYDEEANVWYTTDDKVQNSDNVYGDEILLAVYNETLNTYFYVTEYYEDRAVGRVYYFDAEKKEEAEVPTRMLDKVRGFFVNQGTAANPNWIQVYKKGNGDETAYYYDRQFSRLVDLNVYKVEEKSFYEAIRKVVDGGNTHYTLNNVTIYRKTDADGKNEKFYRTMTTGNIIVDGNTLIINKLHSNLRYVAKFIEVYTEYIFAEPADASGIEVKAVYYTTSDGDKVERDGDFTIIRTDRDGHNLTGENHPDYNPYGIDSEVTTIDQNFFNLYEQEDAKTAVAKAGKTGNLTPAIMQTTVTNPNTGKRFTKYTSESYTNYMKLLRGDFGSDYGKYLVNAEDDELLKGELALRNMYFDVHTSVFIVVGVRSDAELTVHSLGFSPSYVIEPIIEPTEEFINYNQSADASEKYDYLYYVFKVTYDRNPQNDLASYEVHATRYSSIACDVLSGNYSEFYQDHFNLYDNYGNLINYTTIAGSEINTGRRVKLNSYLTTLKNQNIISNEIWATYRNQSFDNVRECLETVSRAARNPGLVYVDHAIAKNGEVDEEGNPIILKSDTDIFNAVKNIKVADEKDPSKMVYYFKTPRLIRRGMQNTVNLSSIPIYSYTIQAITVDDYTYDKSGNLVFTEPEEPAPPKDGEEPEDPDEPQLVLNNSKKHNLKNTIYTAAGTNKYTYLGYGDLFKLDDPVIYVDNKYSENVELHFTDSYINLEYGEENEDKTILSDLPIAENTIVLLEGADDALDGYAFVGWFEQKYNKKSNVCLKQDIYNCTCAPDQECTCEDHECEYGTEGWSELTLMSNDINHPYLTLATADTVIVAVYKKVVDVNISYDNRELNVELPTGNLDSLGQDVTITTDDSTHITTITGKFYFDTYHQLTVSPVGGYRFDGYTFQVSNGAEWSAVYTANYDDKHITYIDRNSEVKDHYDISLNGVMGVGLGMSACLVECIGHKDPYTKVRITLKAKQVTLVHIEVKNFYAYDGSSYKFSGWNFGLYDISLKHDAPQLIAKTINTSSDDEGTAILEYNSLLRDGKTGAKESHYYKVKDSAGNLIQATIKQGTLTLYGYFDIEMSGNLLLVGIDGNSVIRKWYINGHTNTTDTYANVSLYGLPEQRKAFASSFKAAFNINFYYDNEIDNGKGSTIDYNTNNYFALDKDNDVYYARAVIEAATNVTIKHTFIESVEGDGAKTVGVTAGEGIYSSALVYTILAYNGTFSYEDGSGNLVTDNNGTFAVKNSGQYMFSENTTLNLSAQSRFITLDGKLYVFIGWFDSYGNEGSASSYLISEEMSLSAMEPVGIYEAKYVRVHKVELDYNAYGQIIVDTKNELTMLQDSSDTTVTDVFGHYDDGGYYYVMGGAELYVKAYATEGYVLPDFVVTPLEEVAGEVRSTTEDTMDYLKLTIHAVDRAIRISAYFDEGYDITINQMLYSSVDMAQDAEYLTTVYSYIKYRDREVKTTKYVVPKNSSVIFSVKGEQAETNEFPEYFFLGWYVDNVLMSKDIDTGAILFDYQHTLTKDLVIEARFVPYVNVLVSSRLVGLTSTVNKFAYTMTYMDLRTNTECTYTKVNAPISLPAGLVVNLAVNDTNISSAYEFVGWKQLEGTTVLKTFSTEKDANITLSSDLIQGDNIYIYAQFGRKVTLNVYKNITIREEDRAMYFVNGELSDEFKSMFDVVVEYEDLFGEMKVLRLGANIEVVDIAVAQYSNIYIYYELSSIVADRYFLDNIFVKGSGGLTHTYTASDFESATSKNEYVGSQTSINITATFAPSSALTISTELNGTNSSIFGSVVDVEYQFGTGVNAVQGSIDSGSKSIKVPAISEFTVTATNPSKGSGVEKYYQFEGWYNGGTLITTDLVLTEANAAGKIVFGSNINLIARYVAVVNQFIINRVFDGTAATIEKANSLEVSATANFYVYNINTGTGDTKLQTLPIIDGQTSASQEYVVANQKVVLIATHLAGYDFLGFEIKSGKLVSSGSYVANSYQTVMELTPAPCATLEIDAVYVQKTYSVNYVLTSYNSNSNEGGSLTNYTKYIGPDDASISFRVTNPSFVAYVNGTEVTAYSAGSNYSISIPYAYRNCDLTVELRFNAQETYQTKNTTSGNSWFIQGAHQELYAISHKSSVKILSSDLAKLNLVSKADPYSGYSFDTTYRIDYYSGTNTSLSPLYKSAVTNTKPTQTITEYDGNTYVFEGYWARVGTETSYTYIKVGSKIEEAVQGTWANIVAKYRRVEEALFTPSVKGASNTVTYVRTAVNIDPTYVNIAVGNGTQSTYFAFVSGSSFTTNIYAKTANGSYTYTSSSSSFTYTSRIDSVTDSYSLARNNVSTTISVIGSKISYTTCSIVPGVARTATPTTSTNGVGDSVTINPINDEINVTLSINVSGAEEVDKFSTMFVNIYSADGTYYEPLSITKASGTTTIKVKTGSTISLSYSIGDHKQFMYYSIAGVQYTDITYNYKIVDGYGANLTIIGYFSGKYTASIEENDNEKGIASLFQTTKTSSQYSLSIANKEGFMISGIYFATVDSGNDGTYDYIPLYLNSLDINYTKSQGNSIVGLVSGCGYTFVMSERDSDNRYYDTSLTLSFTAVDNVVIKIEYMHVTKLIIEVKEQNASQGEYTFYLSEYADPQVKVADELTLAKLKARIDEVSSSVIRDALSYTPEDLCTFSFEGKTFDDTVYINHSKRDNVLITLNRLTEVKVIVFIEMNYERNYRGESVYGTPQDGLMVSYDNTTVATDKSSIEFTYVSAKSKPLIAEDKNGFFKFDGYYNGQDKDNDVQISSSSDYVLLSTDFNGTKFRQDAYGRYVVHAIFSESLLTISIDADFGTDDANFAISKTDTDAGYIEMTETKQQMLFTDGTGKEIGNLTYFYNYETTKYEITYPASLVKNNVQIYIKAIDFDEVVTDDVYLTEVLSTQGINRFYQKTMKNPYNSAYNEYYRFYRFVDAGGLMVGNLYTNYTSIDLSKYETGTSITTETKELYMIEYTYDYLPDLFYIEMSMTVLKGSNLSTITIGTTQGQSYTEFNKCLIRYLAEKDMNITVSANFLPGFDYALYADFESIVYSNSVMLSDLLLKDGNEYVLGQNGVPGTPTKQHSSTNLAPCGYYINSAKTYWDSLLNGAYTSRFLPVAYYYKADIEYSKFESFNFLAKENTSFVADFYNIAENVKYYIFSVLTNYDYDGFVNNNFTTTGNDFTISFATGKMGLGYFFTLAASGTGYTIRTRGPLTTQLNDGSTRNYAQDFYEETASVKSEQDTSLEWINPDAIGSYDKRIRSYLYYHNYTYDITTDLSATEAQYSQTNIHMMISNVAFLDFSAMRLIKNYQEEGLLYGSEGMPEEEIKEGLTYLVEASGLSYQNYNNHIVKNDQKPYAYSGITYKVRAEMIDGYFFKGFIMISSGYDATYDLIGFGGEVIRPTSKTFTYIPHVMHTDYDDDGNEYYTYAETEDYFTLEYFTKIYAVYEARVYIINLNTYEFKEDNEKLYAEHTSGAEKGTVDNEKSMMTTLDVESAIVKGSLIVEHGCDAKLTSQSLMFMQFVGWSTTKKYDNNTIATKDKFKVAFDTGIGLEDDYSEHVDKGHLTTLKYNDVKAGYYDEDGIYHGNVQGYNVDTEEFASSAARNNIYIYELKHDVDINVYYTYISYKITVNLAEIVPTYVYKDGYAVNDTNDETTTYVTYADYLRDSSSWKNPTIGANSSSKTFTHSYDWGTNSLNKQTFDTSVIIYKNDPYVYVINDNYGNALEYPTKLPYSLVDWAKSQQTGKLVYNKLNTSGTYVAVRCAGTNAEIPYTNQSDKLEDYLGVESFEGYSFDQVYRNGFSFNQSEYVVEDVNGKPVMRDGKLIPKLNNIFNYVETKKVGGSTKLVIKDNLFQIIVDGEVVSTSDFRDVEIDTKTGSIRFDVKVRASQNGLPDVKITMNKNPGIEGVTPHTVEVVKSNDPSVKIGPTFSTTLRGFNLEAFSTSDFITDPNYELPDLDVEIILKWQEKAVAVDTKVTLGTTDVYLSGPNAIKSNIKDLECTTKSQCKHCSGFETAANCNGSYEIMAYFIVIIENGQYYHDLLEPLLKVANEKDAGQASNYYAALIGDTPCETGEYGQVINISDRRTGYFLNSEDRTGLLKLLNRYYNNQFKDVDPDDILKFRTIDTFANFKEGININFYSAIMNSQDLVVNMPLLQEHSHGQYNNWPKKWNTPLTADKGFNYYRNAETGFYSNVNMGVLKYVPYQNNNCTPDDNGDKVGFWKSVGNYIVGIYNGKKKFAATYHRLLHSILVLDNTVKQKQLVTLGASVTITLDTSPTQKSKTIILSGLQDWETIPITNAADAILEILGDGLVVSLIKYLIVKHFDSDATLFEKIANQNKWGMY